MIAIAAALQGWEAGGGVLVLDELTAVLPAEEVSRLFAVVEEVKKVRDRGALRVAPDGPDLPSRRSRQRASGGRLVDHRLRSTRLDPRGLADLMVGDRRGPRLPRAGGEAPRRAGRARGARRPRPLAPGRRPRRSQRRDPRHRRTRGRRLARASRTCSPAARATASAAGSGWRSVERVARDQVMPSSSVCRSCPADRQREAALREFAVSENISLSVLDLPEQALP